MGCRAKDLGARITRPGGPLLVSLLVVLAVLGLACSPEAGDSGPGGSASAEPDTVIAILRAVESPRPTNQDAFLAALAEAGLVVGDNLTVLGIDPAEVYPDEASSREVVRRWRGEGVDLVVALSSLGARVAAAELVEIPVLFLSNDPVGSGLVANERAPEANLTGVTFRVPGDRTLDLVRQVIPDVERVGVLFPTEDPAGTAARESLRTAAARLMLQLSEGGFAGPEDVGASLAGLVAGGVQAVVLANAPTTVRVAPEIEAAADVTGVPVFSNLEVDFALVVLEPSSEQLFRQLARQAVRLLGGTPVSEVPVEDPGIFRVVVNLDVAERLGITVPESVIRSADAVVGG